MRPQLMAPWIYVQFFTLVNEILLQMSDICFGIQTPTCCDLVVFLIIYFNIESVWCLRKIFVHAISMDSTNGYSLF